MRRWMVQVSIRLMVSLRKSLYAGDRLAAGLRAVIYVEVRPAISGGD